MAIADTINSIKTNLSNAYTKAQEKGATIPTNKNIANLEDTIDSIQTGGGSGDVIEKDVNFYDYDGTLLHSYSKTEFLALSALPDLPTSNTMTYTEWNWSLSNAQSYVTNYNELDIGAICQTTDGKMRVYVDIQETAKKPTLGLGINGSVSIDWGDNSQVETLTGTSLSNLVEKTHTYQSAGNYTIEITPASGTTINILGNQWNYYANLFSNEHGSNLQQKYQSSIIKIELPNSVTGIGTSGLADCYNLETINLPGTISLNGSYNRFFSYCYSLKAINFPKLITIIGELCCDNCWDLSKINLSENVTQIKNNAFRYCPIQKITIPENITSIGTSIFYLCNNIKKIIIPNKQITFSERWFYQNKSISEQIKNDYIYNIASFYYECYKLKKISFPSSVTTIKQSFCSKCSSLISVELPSSLTTIEANAFNECKSLSGFVFPSTLTSIENGAFAYLYDADIYDFRNHQSIPTLGGTGAFGSISNNCKIVVPDALYDDWIVATNWSTSSIVSHIVKESEYDG